MTKLTLVRYNYKYWHLELGYKRAIWLASSGKPNTNNNLLPTLIAANSWFIPSGHCQMIDIQVLSRLLVTKPWLHDHLTKQR